MPEQLDKIVELARGRAAARGAFFVETEDLAHVIVNCCKVCGEHENIAALLGIGTLPDGPRGASLVRAYLRHRRGAPALPLTGPAIDLLEKLEADNLCRNLIFPDGEEPPPAARREESAGAHPEEEESEEWLRACWRQWRQTKAAAERPPKAPEARATPLRRPRREPEATEEPQPAARRTAAVSTAWRKAERIRRALAADILGQDRVLDAIHAHALSASCRRNGPAGLFVFLGPPGTGKRYAAKTLAKATGLEYLAINCAQVATNIETKLFLGEQSTISGSGPGTLTAFVEENPAALVCLEHFDAMPQGATAFLDQILSTGALTDLFTERKVDFSRCVIALHLDACAAETHNPRLISRLEREGGAAQVRAAAVEALRAAKHFVHRVGEEAVFAPAILAAIRDRAAICLFRPLDWEALRAIARRGFSRALADCADLLGAPFVEAAPEALEAAADICILERGGETGPSAVSPGALADKLMAALGRAMREREEDAPPPERLELDVPEASRAALSEALETLGEEPVQALLRRFERLACPVEARWDGETLAFVFAGPVGLVKKADARDFGEGGLRIELPETRFADVIGHEAVKKLLKKDLDMLNRWRELRDMGHAPPTGMLLAGVPGTGKTLLARAAAREAGLPFLAVGGQDLLDLKRQDEIFRTARRYAPGIVFIDEIDGIGRRGRSAFDPAVTALLNHLNGFAAQDVETPPIYVLAATNHPGAVDPALLRPGRIERSVKLDLPPPRRFFARELAGLDPDARRALLAASRGMTGAELKAVQRDLALAGATDRQAVLDVVFEAEFGPVVRVSREKRRQASLHEAGHAVCAAVLGVKPRYAALVCREGSVGVVGREHVLGQGPRRALAEIACSLAGALAEQIARRGPGAAIRPMCESAGAQSDLARANKAAEAAVAELGYDGFRCDTGGERPLLPAVQVHERAQAWLNRASRLAAKTLRRNWPAVRAAADALFERGFLDGREIRAIVAQNAPAEAPKRRKAQRRQPSA